MSSVISLLCILVIILAVPVVSMLPVPTVFPFLSVISMFPFGTGLSVFLSVTFTLIVTLPIDELVIIAVVCDSCWVRLFRL